VSERLLCLVPARGGSKGVPRKNLRDVGGKPLIAWTLGHALALATEVSAGSGADHVVDVVVSTDDDEIAEVARRAGAEVPFLRPERLAEDTTATEPVVLHAIDEMARLGRGPTAVMLLQATSPVRLPGTLSRALGQFRDDGVDSMVGVVPHPPFLWQLTDPPLAEYDVAHRMRRQDMTATDLRYRETGSLYVTRTSVYRERANRLGGRIGLFVMDEVEGIDVDTELDIAIAEKKLRELAQR
jgi:CMP-N,N'-diacetyllegionaminic acid synthase